ncbi:heterokaryon incompatibility protein-domain-containing protein [Xylaria grammica]|nr:heterokaryon incompatibility protein-domain-containing protein [Xylaria grammica]
MDYKGLEISGRQIRLITITPPGPGENRETDTIRCTLEVRENPLAVQEPGSESTLPTSQEYLSFDDCVTDPPLELLVAQIRLSMATFEAKLRGMGLAKRALLKVRSKILRQDVDPTLKIPVGGIPELLSLDERKTTMLAQAPDLHRRILSRWGVFEVSEDAQGANILFGDPPKVNYNYIGEMYWKHLNPFCQLRHPSATKQYMLEWVKNRDRYVALSYAWGPPEPAATIIINGQSVKVRANLESALRQLRNMDYFKSLGKIWIDSLCINQNDNAEKQRQVQMMADIYRNAGNVVVWLGPAADESDLVISYLEHVGAMYRAEYVEAFDMADPVTATTWRAMGQIRLKTSYDKFRKWHSEGNKDNIPISLEDIAVPLYKFFDRPYWRRLWIIQELCFGRGGTPIICGQRVTQWRHIRDGVLRCMSIFDLLNDKTRDIISKLPEGTMKGEHSLVHVAQIAQLEIAGHRRELPHVDESYLPLLAPTLYEHGPLLGSVIRRAVTLALQSECSIGKDRVYGMLNVPGLPQMNIEVDYAKSLGAIFAEFTKACVEHGSLDFFAAIDGECLTWINEQGEIQRDTKPSWVPDYGAMPARRIGVIEGEWYAGGRVPTSWAKARIDGGTRLCCAGKVVDTIDGVGAVSKADLDINATLGDDISSILQQPKSQKASTGRDPNIHEVLMGGCDANGSNLEASAKCLYEAFPAKEPSTSSPYYRNWHFLNSSADLLIQGRPLSSYFTPFEEPPLAEPTISPGQSSDSPQPADAVPVSDLLLPAQPPATIERKIESAAPRQAMEARTKMRRLIVTESSGDLGIAPLKTQPGDAVIIVAGHSKPLIAREVGTSGQGYWHLIGEAYIDGMMNSKLPISDKPWSWYSEGRISSAALGTIIFV